MSCKVFFSKLESPELLWNGRTVQPCKETGHYTVPQNGYSCTHSLICANGANSDEQWENFSQDISTVKRTNRDMKYKNAY